VWRFVLQHAEDLRGAPRVKSELDERVVAPARTGGAVGGGASTPPTSTDELDERGVALARTGGAVGGVVSTPPTSTDRLTTPEGKAFRRTIHETIARVTEGIEKDFHFNTAISAIMELVNALYAFEAAARDTMPADERATLLREAVETVLLLLGPFSPHVTEELWQHLGHADSLFKQPWPTPDPTALTRQEVTVVLQVDGKVRGRLTLEVDAVEDRVRGLALADDKVRRWLQGRTVERVVVVPNRLVNVVTRS